MNFIFSFVLSMFVLAGVQSLEMAPMKKNGKGAEIRFLAHQPVHLNNSAFIGHLTVPAKGKVPLHRDASEEYLYVLEGQGTLWIEGQNYFIKKDDLVFMPANVEVRFENGDKPLKALQVFAPQGPEEKYDDWKMPVKPGVKGK